MNRKQIAINTLQSQAKRITPAEKQRHQAGKATVSDSIISLKALVPAGGNKAILDAENNKDAILGVIDFENGRIKGINGQGSIVVEAIKVGHATATAGEIAGTDAANAYAKNFAQDNFPADIEHSYLEILQDGEIVKKIHLSPFSMASDNPQTLNAGRMLLGEPFVLAGETDTEIRLRRPKQISGTACFLSIDFIGMQSVNHTAS